MMVDYWKKKTNFFQGLLKKADLRKNYISWQLLFKKLVVGNLLEFSILPSGFGFGNLVDIADTTRELTPIERDKVSSIVEKIP